MRNWIILALLAGLLAAASAADVMLVQNGMAKVCVVTPAEPDQNLKWAAEDLVTYLGKMSGATVTAADKPAAGLLPIYLGSAPEKLPMTAKSEYGDAYLIDVSDQRIVLQGETTRATYYAAATLLHALGVRWYAPGELGEVVPQQATLKIAAGRTESAPHFQSRHLWADGRWSLRNRMGGPAMAQGHGFHGLMEGGKHFKDHPEYYPVINGKPANAQANLSSDAVAELFAKNIAAGFRKGPNSWAGGNGACVGPDDGALIDERPETRALQNGEIDPLLQLPSMSDPFVNLVNKVATKLEGEFPNHYLGFYVYSNHNMPPTRFMPHKMIFPIVAPISYTRYGSIGNPNVPTSMLLEDVIKAWRASVPRMGSYLYNFNLADTAMPFTRTLYFEKSMPKLYELGVHYSTVESMNDNWQHSLPGGYVYAQVTWDVKTDVDKIRDEFYPNFYGPAAASMRRYNAILEEAYETTPAFAGNVWSMHRIFPPARVKELAACLAEAKKLSAGKAPYTQRVEIAGCGLRALECWLNARRALNDGKLAEAAKWNDAYKAGFDDGSKKYPGFIGRMAWGYYRGAHHPSFTDAGRLAKEGNILYRFPDGWKGILDKDQIGIRDCWFSPGMDVSGWGTLRTYGVSLDEQGAPFFRGYAWYRHDFTLPKAAQNAKTLRLWIGGVDDTAHVYVNGTKIGTYGGKYFAPVDVNITAAAKRQGTNTIVVAVSNFGINELGTGGICRPVFLYEPKAKVDDTKDEKKGNDPLFGGQ
ncbi:MAG: DUF4838 domain-containing protein [Armatimonadota bacterium]